MGDDRDISRLRGLGRFVGHLWHAVRTPTKTDRQELGRASERTEQATPDGRKVVLRRTTIEEVEVQDDDRSA